MKRKLISLLCAVTMVFSVVGSMTLLTASAEGEVKVVGTVTGYDEATRKATISVGYEGLPETAKVNVFQAFVKVDTDIFEAPVKEKGRIVGVTMNEAMTGDTGTLVHAVVQDSDKITSANIGWNTGEPDFFIQGSSGDAFTMELTLKEGATLPATVSIESVVITDVTVGAMGQTYGTEDQNPDKPLEVVNPIVRDPNGNPEVTATPKPRPTAPPSASEAPKPTGVYVEGALQSYDAATRKAVIKVSYAGLPETAKVNVFQAFVKVDTDIFEAPVKEKGRIVGVTMNEAMTGDTGTLVHAVVQDSDKITSANIGWNTGEPDFFIQGSSGDAFTMELTLKEGATLPATVSIESVVITDVTVGAMGQTYGTADQNPDKSLEVVNPVIQEMVTPTEAPSASPKVPVKEPVKMGSIVSDETVSKIEKFLADAKAAGKDAMVQLEVTFEGKPDAKYGEDYVARYGDTVLSQYAYELALQGDFSEVEKETGVSGIDWDKFVTGTEYDIYNNAITGVNQNVVGWRGTYDENGNFTPEGNGEELGTGSTTTTTPSSSPSPGASANPSASPSASETPGGTGGTGTGGSGGGTIIVGGNGGGNNSSNIYTGTNIPNQTTNPGAGTPFTDVDAAHAWAVPAINYLYQAGIIEGRTSLLFDPDATVTRAEFTKMVVGASGLAPSGTPSFPDAAGHWAAPYIATAEQYGVVTGYTADTFAPDKTINRQEMAAIVYRAATAVNKDMPSGSLGFADAGSIDDYAKAPVASLAAKGIIQGVGNNTFDPKGNATRAQAAVIVYNYMTK